MYTVELVIALSLGRVTITHKFIFSLCSHLIEYSEDANHARDAYVIAGKGAIMCVTFHI